MKNLPNKVFLCTIRVNYWIIKETFVFRNRWWPFYRMPSQPQWWVEWRADGLWLRGNSLAIAAPVLIAPLPAVSEGMSADAMAAVSETARALRAWAQQHGLLGQAVGIVIPEEWVSTRTLNKPSEWRLSSLVSVQEEVLAELDASLPQAVDEWAIDFEEDAGGATLTVAMVPQARLAPLLALFAQAGWSVAGVGLLNAAQTALRWNFLPWRVQARTARRTQCLWAMAGLGLLAIVIMAVWSLTLWQAVASSKRQLAAIQLQAKQVQKQNNAIVDEQKQLQELRRQLAQWQGFAQARTRDGQLLAALPLSMPNSVYLTQWSLTGLQMKLLGETNSNEALAAWMQSMTASGLVAATDLQEVQTEGAATAAGYSGFEMSATLGATEFRDGGEEHDQAQSQAQS